MSVLLANKQYWRLAFMVLLVVALISPWAIFDIISIPAPFECTEPWVQMDENFCGYPASPLGTFMIIILDSLQIIPGLGGSAVDSAGMLSYLPGLIFTLPLITSLVLLVKKESKPWQILHVVGLALISALSTFYLYLLLVSRVVYWGLWLYIGLLILMLVFEIITLVGSRQPAAASESSGS
jgi:hypothetical protein